MTMNRLITDNTRLTIILYFQSLSTHFILKVCVVGMEASREGTSEKSTGLYCNQNQKHIQASSSQVPLTEHPENLALKSWASWGQEVLLHKVGLKWWSTVSKECARFGSRLRVCEVYRDLCEWYPHNLNMSSM